MRLQYLCIFLIASVGATCLAGWAHADLTLNIETNKPEYAVREPVWLSVRYENDGSRPLSIMPASELGSNMTCTFYEITEPDKTVVRRKHQYAYITGLVTTEYAGDLLEPSDFIQVNMYPTLSRSVPGDNPSRRGFTFPVPGDYELRLAYVPPATYRLLWRPTDGQPVYSNVLRISVRAATAEESEILDAYWSAGGADLAMGDDAADIEINEPLVRSVLAKYPEHAFADYLRFNLARGLLKGRTASDEAVGLLEGLRPKEEFRWDEVHAILGTAYSVRGEDGKAREVLFEAIRHRPTLLHNYAFMYRVIMSETKSFERIVDWEQECARGERMRFAGIAIPQDILQKGLRDQ